jgi:FdhD protein
VRDNPPVPTVIDPHVARTAIERVRAGSCDRAHDEVAIEEPLEIRVDGRALAVTMRTPGEDEELAVGFLAGEALIGGPGDVRSAGPTHDFAANVVEVHTTGGMRRDPSAERRFHLTSSCGICGKGALEDVRLAAPPVVAPPHPVTPELVLDLPRRAREQQAGFDRTGGLHATGLFDAAGRLLVLREDVGRHNAMDKAIGSLLLAGHRPPAGTLASLSGRIGFELVQKAALAGLAGLIAVGAPTSLAVELARERGLVLCGFVRDERFNVYAGAEHLRAAGSKGHSGLPVE